MQARRLCQISTGKHSDAADATDAARAADATDAAADAQGFRWLPCAAGPAVGRGSSQRCPRSPAGGSMGSGCAQLLVS